MDHVIGGVEEPPAITNGALLARRRRESLGVAAVTLSPVYSPKTAIA